VSGGEQGAELVQGTTPTLPREQDTSGMLDTVRAMDYSHLRTRTTASSTAAVAVIEVIRFHRQRRSSRTT
jgi:hypothetical protein